jgi:hypothetical protein
VHLLEHTAEFSAAGLIETIRHRQVAKSRLLWGHAFGSSFVITLYLAWSDHATQLFTGHRG